MSLDLATVRAMSRALIAVVALAIVTGGCGADDSASGKSASAPETAPNDAAASSGGGCTKVNTPRPKADGGQKRPTTKLSAGKTYDVTLKTNCGSFTIQVDQKASPNTAASFVALARKGFFDGTTFHRIVPGFVIQGGDPTGSGQGGPGYSTRDVPPAGTKYTRGVVAMAKTGSEAPGTAGSQFYVVTGADAGLPPDYALLGKVSEGLAVTGRIDKLGDPASADTGTPLQPVVIQKATVSKKG